MKKIRYIFIIVFILFVLHMRADRFSDKDTYAAGLSKTDSYDVLVDDIKEELISRNTVFSVSYSGDLNGLKTTELFRKALDDACSDSSKSAPNEGDYVAYSLRKYTLTASTTGKSTVFSVKMKYMDSASKEKQVTRKIAQLKKQWNISSLSDIEKIKYIHDYVVSNVKYDKKHKKYTAYDALIGGSSVCQGYSLLMYRLCKIFGIETRIISGKKKGTGESHVWNIVKADGKYYNIDTTWDSTMSDGSKIIYDYFLLSDADIRADHIRDKKYTTKEFVDAYPVSTETFYFDDKKLNTKPLDYSFITTDGKEISQSTSSATILIFGSPSNSLLKKQVKNITGSEINKNSGVRIAEINIYNQTEAAFRFLKKASLINGDSTILPITLLIDQSNRIRYAYIGECVRDGRIIKNLNTFDGISINKDKEVVYTGNNSDYATKGSTQKSGTLMYVVTKSGENACEVICKKGLDKNEKKIVIPDFIKINGLKYNVVSIADNAFYNFKKLTNLTVGKNIRSINTGAFTGCINIRKIVCKSSCVKVNAEVKKLINNK